MKQPKRTKSAYGVMLTKSEAFAFNFFQNNFANFLPSMNTLYPNQRAAIVNKWLNDREDGVDEETTAKQIRDTYIS